MSDNVVFSSVKGCDQLIPYVIKKPSVMLLKTPKENVGVYEKYLTACKSISLPCGNYVVSKVSCERKNNYAEITLLEVPIVEVKS